MDLIFFHVSRFPEYVLSRTFSICCKTFIICTNKFRHISVRNKGDLKLYSSLALFRMAWLFMSHSVTQHWDSIYFWFLLVVAMLYCLKQGLIRLSLGFRSSAPSLLFRNIQWPLLNTTVRGITVSVSHKIVEIVLQYLKYCIRRRKE